MKTFTVDEAKLEAVLKAYKELEERFRNAEAVLAQCSDMPAIEYARLKKLKELEENNESKQ